MTKAAKAAGTEAGSAPPAEAPPEGLWAKILWVMAHVTQLEKTGTNAEFGYSYVEEAYVVAQLRPLLVRAGLVVLFSEKGCTQLERWSSRAKVMVPDITKLEVEYTIVDAATGDKHVGTMYSYGQDTQDKGPYKALTGAVKYVLAKTFLMSTGDDPENDEGRQPEPERNDERQPARGNTRQRQPEAPQGEPDPLNGPVTLATAAKVAELIKHPLLPPAEVARAEQFMAKPGRIEREALTCLNALQRQAKAAEDAEEEEMRRARGEEDYGDTATTGIPTSNHEE